ncbi:MAG: hypothetical protein K2L13_02780, partial [Opitutales bacterium]|nr:hypothetical protein [Opitutales bacterium]
DQNKSFDDVYEDVVKEYLSIAIRKLANEKADLFVCELYNKDIKLNSDEFQHLLDKFEVSKEKVAAYSRLKLPVVPGVSESALFGVFNLDDSRYYSDAFSTDSGAAVLLVEGRKKSRILSFDEAKSYVKNDIIESKKSAHFKDVVDDLRSALSQLSSEKQMIGKLREYDIECNKYENISLSKDPNAISPEYWEALGDIPINGKVGVARRGKEDVSFVIILNRNTPKMSDMLERNGDKFKNQLLLSNRNFEFVEYANWLVQKELSKLR